MITVSPNKNDIQLALQAFLNNILSVGIEVIEGQENKVSEPNGDDYVVMWAISKPRLNTNVDEESDVFFTGLVDGTILIVSSIAYGQILLGTTLFGPNVIDGTTIISDASGSEGIGAFNISPSQVIASQNFAAGYQEKTQNTEVIYQLHVHGSSSADNVQIISTLFRDEYGISFIAGQNENISPLFTDDPKQVPFINSEQQYEERWIIEVHLQVNATIIVPQQFADIVTVNIVNVETISNPSPSLDFSQSDNSQYQPLIL